MSVSVPRYHNRNQSASPHVSPDTTSILFHCESQSRPAVQDRLIDLRPLVRIRRRNERSQSPLRSYHQPSSSHITPPPHWPQTAAVSPTSVVLNGPPSSDDTGTAVDPNSSVIRRSHRQATRSHAPAHDPGSPIVPLDTASFASIDDLCNSIEASADVDHSNVVLQIEAEPLIHAATGLVGWLRHQRLHADDLHPYKSPSNASTFLIHPDAPEDQLNIFSMIWQVRAYVDSDTS